MQSTSALVVAIAAALASSPVALAGDFRPAADPVRGEYIVVLEPDAARLDHEPGRARPVAAVADEFAARFGANVLRSYRHVLRGFVVAAGEEAVARMAADPRVAFVEENGRVELSGVQTGATWGLDRIDQRDLPLDGTFAWPDPSATVAVYVVDTGVLASHAEFSGRIGAGYDAIGDGQGSNDCNGHGTHVAGTAAGSTWGVAKTATVHPVRVLDCAGYGDWGGIIAGLDWIRGTAQAPAVANMSLGGPGWGDPDGAVDLSVQNLVDAGVVVVAAAGNQGADACLMTPARAPAAITVAATAGDDGRAWYSNHGSCVDLFAPGSGITSAWHTATNATWVLDGTSMAAPHVAGAAALYLGAPGNALHSPAQVTAALVGSSSPGRVLAAGPGSPNRLLFVGGGTAGEPPGDGTLPVIDSFVCPSRGDSGGGMFVCYVSYSSTSPATVLWPGPGAGDQFQGYCSEGPVDPITVTVGNRYGSTSRTSPSFQCPTGPIP